MRSWSSERISSSINPATEEEQECRIVYLGDTSEKGTRIGVEFLSPSPHFWGVEFAQKDWASHLPVDPLELITRTPDLPPASRI